MPSSPMKVRIRPVGIPRFAALLVAISAQTALAQDSETAAHFGFDALEAVPVGPGVGPVGPGQQGYDYPVRPWFRTRFFFLLDGFRPPMFW